jgi:hypothetical protein
MTRARRLIISLIVLAFAAPTLWSLDISQGLIKLTLNEGIGRFSIACLTDEKAKTYKQLLVTTDPRTSFTSIMVGSKVYRLGESFDFRQSTERTAAGARFVWSSSLLTVSQEFTFIDSVGSGQTDGVRIDLVLKNISTQDLTVGVRYLLDTYLGESSYVHFTTDKNPQINKELAIGRDDKIQYWVSPLSGDPEHLGLMCMLSGEGITSPDRVVFANWKRLNDAVWSYETSQTRNFNLLPYSVNDSAVSLYFDARSIARGSELRIVTVLGKYSASGFTLAARPAAVTAPVSTPAQAPEASQASQPASDAAQVAPTAPSGAPTLSDLKAELEALEALIATINAKLAAGQEVTGDELAKMADAIEKLHAGSGSASTTPVTSPQPGTGK